MRNNRKQVVFSDSISVRTKVSPAGTITVTVLNDTTMETLTHVFSFKDILTSGKKVEVQVPKEEEPQDDNFDDVKSEDFDSTDESLNEEDPA